MLRGIFGAPGISKEAQDWYIDLLKKVTETPEWVEFTDKGGLKRAFLNDQDFITWLESTGALHKDLMGKDGLLNRLLFEIFHNSFRTVFCAHRYAQDAKSEAHNATFL